MPLIPATHFKQAVSEAIKDRESCEMLPFWTIRHVLRFIGNTDNRVLIGCERVRLRKRLSHSKAKIK